MGLIWQQAPHGPNPAGRFLSANPIPEHVLYAEPAGRRMHAELAGAVVAASDNVTLLHETGRYPVAYFPPADVNARLLRTSARRTSHPELGEVAWWSIHIGGQCFENVAWSHPSPPAHAAAMTDLIAFVWAEMDAFYEEDEPIFGHAADPYHRVDVRASSRQVTVRLHGQVIAATRAPWPYSRQASRRAGTCPAKTSTRTRSQTARSARYAPTRASRTTSTSSPPAIVCQRRPGPTPRHYPSPPG
jgi:uncharacterized protein (DUF427 family)